MSLLDEFQKLVKQFEKVQRKYAKFGAEDTEPDGVFQVLLVRAFRGKKPEVPTTVRGWQVYDKPRADLVAAALAAAAAACVESLATLDDKPHGQVKEVEESLKDYCWRVDW